jgi:hypothetical protein
MFRLRGPGSFRAWQSFHPSSARHFSRRAQVVGGIPYQGQESGHRDMADFIASLDDNRLRALLDVTIRGKGAFRRFKDVLQEHPEQRERWFAFQKECVLRRIRRWLESEDIEPITPRRAD